MTLLRLLTLLVLIAVGMSAYAYRIALSDPVVRTAEVTLPGLPPGTRLRAILISDIHVAGPDMPPQRLEGIVAQVNRLRPDIVFIAGDLVSDKRVATRHYGMAEATAPLASLRARLGIFAVLGNHDHWRDTNEARAALRASGITVLDNEAARAGPLAIGGLDDAFTGRDDLPQTLEAMRRTGGAPLLISHSPDPFPSVPEEVGLMLAGHTHCGQIRLPIVGAVSYMSEHGERYACGLVRENGKALIVSAGLGTSVLPLRLGAAPDMWLIGIEGERQGGRAPPRRP